VNPQSGVALIESPSLTLNPLISRVLKQSYGELSKSINFCFVKTNLAIIT
jgi:hypothetical protein